MLGSTEYWVEIQLDQSYSRTVLNNVVNHFSAQIERQLHITKCNLCQPRLHDLISHGHNPHTSGILFYTLAGALAFLCSLHIHNYHVILPHNDTLEGRRPLVIGVCNTTANGNCTITCRLILNITFDKLHIQTPYHYYPIPYYLVNGNYCEVIGQQTVKLCSQPFKLENQYNRYSSSVYEFLLGFGMVLLELPSSSMKGSSFSSRKLPTSQELSGNSMQPQRLLY